eukprot:CAMPEP_0170598536 /NCGR_PEP_ID=MMETSP0224-20130122/16303_1 /TAXON_ID=285029 /ORGANISM="Togula jolla, Strain CCCM 725" /LENGTH=402 /DNA_ID=CAMNT_0010923101 /DNA_START=119 /DNA_END=1327 /DNA_ORIENTATION=-
MCLYDHASATLAWRNIDLDEEGGIHAQEAHNATYGLVSFVHSDKDTKNGGKPPLHEWAAANESAASKWTAYGLSHIMGLSLLTTSASSGDIVNIGLMLSVVALILLVSFVILPPTHSSQCPERGSRTAMSQPPARAQPRARHVEQKEECDAEPEASPLLECETRRRTLPPLPPTGDTADGRDFMHQLAITSQDFHALTPRDPAQMMKQRCVSAGSRAQFPMLCPALVLPDSEAWFAVAFDKLEQTTFGSFDLFGLSGKTLLKGTTSLTTDGRPTFAVSMTHVEEDDILAAVTAGKGASMQLKSGSGRHYGYMIPNVASHERYTLVCEGKESLTLYFDPDTGRLLVTSLLDRSTLAIVTRCTASAFFKDTDHLEICVGPGVDAVLVLCCVIGVVLFGSPPFQR